MIINYCRAVIRRECVITSKMLHVHWSMSVRYFLLIGFFKNRVTMYTFCTNNETIEYGIH
jgi:hypothetical protein